MTTSIAQSDRRFPGGIHPRRDFDRHIRQWKQEIHNCFKNCTNQVTSTDTELDHMYGVPNYLTHMQILTASYSNTLLNGDSGNLYTITPSPAYTSLPDGATFCIQLSEPQDNPILTSKLRVNSLEPVNFGTEGLPTITTANSIIVVQYRSDVNEFNAIQI